ncbi:MAG: GPR endopeptidase [Bacillota bacterium]|jgi:spore protease
MSDFLQKFFNYTNLVTHLDMADEANRLLRGAADVEIPGVKENLEEINDIKITTIDIINSKGQEIMNKACGTYITLEIPGIGLDKQLIDNASFALACKLRTLLPKNKSYSTLVIGLGNNAATPDSLGPHVIEATMPTRHIFQYASEAEKTLPGIRSLACLAPGVLGITGIETAEIIKGVLGHVKPDVIIAVDSLASASITRVGTSIQLSNTGIDPGSGVNNKRMPLNQETLHIPVIAIGVPTVVNTMVIIHEALINITKLWQRHGFNNLPQIDRQTIEILSKKLLSSFEGNLIVTPKEIDQLIKDVSKIIAAAIAQAVHQEVNQQNYHLYLN